MKETSNEVADLRERFNSLQTEVAALRERVAGLESSESVSGKHKKKKKHKAKKSDSATHELEEVLRTATHEQLVATIVRYHKDPRQIAKKIARQQID